MSNYIKSIVLFCALALAWLFQPVSLASAETIDSQYDLEVFSGLGLEDGEASLALFFKPETGRSERVPYTVLFGRPDRPKPKAVIEIDDIPVRTNTFAVAISGKLKMANSKVFYVPIVVEAFGETDRRDVLHSTSTLSLTERELLAFERSYPINKYNCRGRIDQDELEMVVLASRAMLTEQEIYLANDQSWDCLEKFFKANASIMNQIDPERLNDVLEFLSNYRAFQPENASSRFTGLYLKFLRELIGLNILGTSLSDTKTLKDQMRAELLDVFSQNTVSAISYAGSMFEALRANNAPDLCLDLAATLFFNVAALDEAEMKQLALTRGDADALIEYAMNASMDCAIRQAVLEDIDFTLGSVRATSQWLKKDYAEYMQTFVGLYNHLDSEGWITQQKVFDNPLTKRVHDNFVEIYQAFPRPQPRPEA